MLAVSVPLIVLVLSSVPHDLVHDLGNGNWVRSRAVGAAETAAVGVRDMALVVWRINILPIPARWEDDGCTDALGAVLVWQLASVLAIAWCEALSVSEASMADRDSVVFGGGWVTSDHAEAGLECSHLVVFGAVWHVVDCHATILLKSYVGELGDALERAVLRRPEVQCSGPVVAEILAVCAGCAGGLGRGIEFSGFHLVVSVVAANVLRVYLRSG